MIDNENKDLATAISKIKSANKLLRSAAGHLKEFEPDSKCVDYLEFIKSVYKDLTDELVTLEKIERGEKITDPNV